MSKRGRTGGGEKKERESERGREWGWRIKCYRKRE